MTCRVVQKVLAICSGIVRTALSSVEAGLRSRLKCVDLVQEFEVRIIAFESGKEAFPRIASFGDVLELKGSATW